MCGLSRNNNVQVFVMNTEMTVAKVSGRFPGIVAWNPPRERWKDRTILLGFRVKANDDDYYVFLGKNGLGRQINRQREIVPLYCEIALANGGDIEEKMGDLGKVVFRLLPEYKRKKSYYRFASFAEGETEAAGQKLLDTLTLLLPEPVR